MEVWVLQSPDKAVYGLYQNLTDLMAVLNNIKKENEEFIKTTLSKRDNWSNRVHKKPVYDTACYSIITLLTLGDRQINLWYARRLEVH